jgi:hypothetical protein
MKVFTIFGVSTLMSLVSSGVIAKLYAWPRLRIMNRHHALLMQLETTRSHLITCVVQRAARLSLNWVHQEHRRAQRRADPAGNHS